MSDIFLLPDERLDKVNEDITLIQKKDGLTFGTDAYLLAAFIKKKARGHAVELGAGTGIISLLLASKNKFAKITAIEIQEVFASLAKRNVEYNSRSDFCKIICADIRDVRPSDIGGEADAVFTNPPYMKTDSGKRNESDGKYIARHEVCGTIDDFCAAGARLLKHGGKFYAVWRPDRACDLLCSMRAHSLEPKLLTFVHADAVSCPSMMLICATKGGASGMKVTPPLLLHNAGEHKVLTQEAQKIYDTMSFED